MIRTATALIAACALALLPGCGEDKKTIPHDEGASLIRLLRDARDLAGDSDKCPQLQVAVRRVQTRVAALPSSVDKDTRDSLVNGVNNLIDNARSECENVKTTPTKTTPTDTVPTETTPTETQPTQTQPTQTQPTTTTPPPQTTPTTPGGNGGVTPGNPPEVAPGQEKKGDKKGGKK
jgi:hypothetical protein